ncbi:cytochrome b/b6 domain-containing protein [Algibacillus agarilyticus]|uniref:cytochrome b/b6 domain-containing protein n=1 Tax=Algibacillus agarilyticus TaxID=2234133 RepID=UPI0018E544AB|nr:cytochrome b/b6 domain-containing protein [Algibacillus agarilyticus]
MPQTIQSQISDSCADPELMNTDIKLHIQITGATPRNILVWDIPVRVIHWLLVVMMIIAYSTHLLGYDYYEYHVWSGYCVCVLVAFRIVWGIVGTYHARFINFIKGPKSTYHYLRKISHKESKTYMGHNPLGALMVVALLAGLLVQSITGLFANDEVFNVGPLYLYIDEELSLQLTSLHRLLFYWIFAAVVIHILAIFLHRVLKGEQLAKAMLTGKKLTYLHNESSIPSSKLKLALAILLVILVGFISLIQLA